MTNTEVSLEFEECALWWLGGEVTKADMADSLNRKLYLQIEWRQKMGQSQTLYVQVTSLFSLNGNS